MRSHSVLPGCGPLTARSDTPDSIRQKIFERIRAEGAVSRAKIAKDLNTSPATVTTQTAALIDMGFVKELAFDPDPTESGRGRPPIALGVEPKAHLVAGLKLSDREHTGVILDFAGTQIASAASPVSSTIDPASVLDTAVALVQSLCAAAGLRLTDLSAVGIGLPGFIDHARGKVHWSPVIDAADFDLAQTLSVRLGLPVTIDNDANLVALAEQWFGVGRQIADFAVVTIEHGVGMGLVVNHRLYRGAHGLGVELGHTKIALEGALCRCGQRGCVEAYVADYALVREAAVASAHLNDSTLPMATVLEHLYRDAKAGNAAAQSIFDRAGRYLALALANVLNLFDPELIILSGARMQYEYLYADAFLADIRRHAVKSQDPLPRIEVHAWGDLLWASGAGALALSYVSDQHLALDRSLVS